MRLLDVTIARKGGGKNREMRRKLFIEEFKIKKKTRGEGGSEVWAILRRRSPYS